MTSLEPTMTLKKRNARKAAQLKRDDRLEQQWIAAKIAAGIKPR